MATDAPKIDFNTFEGLYSTVTLLIPKKSIETYAISNWGQFDSLKYIDAEEETTTYSDGELNYFIILADNDRDKNIAIVKSGNYSDLSSVVIPEIVTDNKSNNYYITGIGSAAFNGCNGLKEIHFNKSSAITIIGSYAFSNTAITSIEFPSTLTKIEDGAFNHCTSLGSISIPNSVTFIGSSAFKYCYSLASVTLGNSIKSISDESFCYCNLKRIVLPPLVETIGSYAFAGNSYLNKIVLGRNVKSIGDYAFNTAYTSTIYITAPVPPTVAPSAFRFNSARLYVQGGTNLDAYYDAAFSWLKFEGYVMSEPQSLTMEEPATKPLGKTGETFTLKATLTPANVDLPYIFWRSTDPTKAYVDNDGKVTVLQNITAEDNVEIIAETLYYNGPIAKFSFATDASGIDEIVGDSTSTMDVYTLQGVEVLRNATREQFENLARGIYIVRSGKSVKKVVK